jgi:hypothetical protein
MRFFAPLLILVMFNASCLATHLRGGQIQIVQQGQHPGTYEITVLAYTRDTGSTNDVLFGGDGAYLDFGDGTIEMVPFQQNILLYILGNGEHVSMAYFTTTHTYSKHGNYVVNYREANRNLGVINMSQSGYTEFYVESGFRYDGSFYSTPNLLAGPTFYTKVKDNLSFSFAATDIFNHTLYYELVSPQQDRGMPVAQYQVPDNFSINQFNGLAIWNSKYQSQFLTGEFSYAVKISQYTGEKQAGYMIVDLQLIVDDVDLVASITDNIALDVNNRIYLLEGNSIKFKVIAEGEHVDSVALNILSELKYVSSGAEQSVSFNVYDSAAADKKIRVGVVTLTATSARVRDNPYAITARAIYRSDLGILVKDITYLLYTKDIELSAKPVDEMNAPIDSTILWYPNPVDKDLTIRTVTRDALALNFQIVDSMGRTMGPVPLRGSDIDVSELAKGIYILILKSPSGTNKTIKFVKN